MKKLLFSILVVLVSCTLMVVLAMAEKEDPPEPPPIFQTRVVNDETEPVPVQGLVSGVVTIDNFPVTQVITGTVDIGNLPAVQDVEVVNSINNPIVASCTNLKEPIQAEVSAEDLWYVTLYTVPDDRLLEIRYISIQQYDSSDTLHFFAELDLMSNGERKSHTLQAFSGPIYDPLGDSTRWILAQSLSLHADPGSQVRLSVFNAIPYMGGKASLAGVLEPLVP